MARQKTKTRRYKVHVAYKTISAAMTKLQAEALKREIKRKAKQATVVVKPA